MNFFTMKHLCLRSRILLALCISLAAVFSVSAQTVWEFDGNTYAFQKAHFDSATAIIKRKLGIQMHTFGAPYNQIDPTFIQVMSEDTNYKVLLYGQNNPAAGTGAINLTRRVNIESATGVPSYSTLVADFNDHKTSYTDYMVMQGHPYAWTTPEKQTEFQNIVNYLIEQGVQFTTPYEYYRYVKDSSIPRTSKIQVILKLDDLRATSSYFKPCFAAYDFLVSKKIKAAFGVNNMGTLIQSQIDTLNYYLRQTDSAGTPLFEIWNHGLDHSMKEGATTGGNWSLPATWPSGVVPTSADDVTIASGSTVTIDGTNAVCNNLTISGTLTTATDAPVNLTVYGDITILSGGSFTSPALTGATANVVHSMTVYGDFTNTGGTFDFRTGSSGTTMRVLNTTFAGNSDSRITVGTYSSSNNSFNGITINKTGGAKVICGSDVYMDQGASTCVSQLNFISGMIETGTHSFNVLSLSGTDIVNPSATSYVNGALGRGMSNSGGTAKLFPVGDATAYRPITIKSTTAGTASGHNCVVRCVDGNANAGTTGYLNGIDSVSKVRYFQLSYNKGIGAAATSMSFSQFSPSYGADDNVSEGQTNLRVAYSTDNRLTWNGMDQSPIHTASITTPPTAITPSALTAPLTLNTGSGSIYIALAKGPESPTKVTAENNVQPTRFALAQNYPNPFNPTTSIRYELPASGMVSLKIFDVLGSEVAELVNEEKPGGVYQVQFDASSLASGVYYYQIRSGTFSKTMKMLLLR